MRFGRRDPSKRTLAVEITPMIDVVFLLIVFFMTAAQFSREQRTPMQLPVEMGQEEDGAPQGLVINLMDDGRVLVQDESLDDTALEVVVREHLAAASRGGGGGVTIRADRRGTTAPLNRLVRKLEGWGVSGVRIGTERP